MGHVAVFVVAVQVTGTKLPVGRLLPLALVVLLASPLQTYLNRRDAVAQSKQQQVQLELMLLVLQ